MKSKIAVNAETTSYSYVILHDAAAYALESARNSEDGRFFNCLSAMLYSAFSLEAYLNHLGEHEIQNWEKSTRHTSPGEKLSMLAKKRGYTPDFINRPFDTFKKIFDFRKMIVHGKTEIIKVVEEIQEGEFGEIPVLPTAPWEKSTTLENAAAFVEDSASMIRLLHPNFGYEADPFFTEWKSSWETKPI